MITTGATMVCAFAPGAALESDRETIRDRTSQERGISRVGPRDQVHRLHQVAASFSAPPMEISEISLCATRSHHRHRHLLETLIQQVRPSNEEITMTMPDERTRALVWGGGFLIEIARDSSLPAELRRRAVAISRHFPTVEQIEALYMAGRASSIEPWVVAPKAHPEWAEACPHGPLTFGTRLGLPEEPP
jgi:hypothetical protein